MKNLARLLLALAVMVGATAAGDAAWNAGVYSLASKTLTTAVTAETQSTIVNLVGLTATDLEAAFAYGSGGTTCNVTVQTSLDGGTTWRDVAFFAFTTASAVKYANVSGLTPKGVTAYAALSADGVNDGLLGDRLRAVITSTGTYASTTVTVRAAAR